MLQAVGVEEGHDDGATAHACQFAQDVAPFDSCRNVLQQPMAQHAGERTIGERQRVHAAADTQRFWPDRAQHRGIAVELDHGARQFVAHAPRSTRGVEPWPGSRWAALQQGAQGGAFAAIGRWPMTAAEAVVAVAFGVAGGADVGRLDHVRTLPGGKGCSSRGRRDVDAWTEAIMQDQQANSGVTARRDPRVDLDGEVTIQFEAGAISGSGQNISVQGVFFTADVGIPVTVRVKGHGEVAGKLVRVESMGEGRLGIAVRFDAPQPSLLA